MPPSPQSHAQGRQPTPFQTRIKTIRSMFQVLGAIVCTLFAVQGGVIFSNNSDVKDFWAGCHWIAEGAICIIIGVGGCILEVRGLLPSVRQHLRYFLVNRLATAVVYLWIGCYSMGGRVQASEAWSILGRVTGIIAWVVGVADALMSCCSDRSERPASGDEDGKHQQKPSGAQQKPSGATSSKAATVYGSPAAGGPSAPSAHAAEAGAAEPAEAAPAPRPGHAAEADNPFAESPDAPTGGWADVGAKPFGAG